MFVGNIMALPQHRIKRMLAYSSVAQVGYIVLGFGIGFHYLVPAGFEGGLFHIITHAGMKGLAFLLAGIIIYYTGTHSLDEMKGLAKKMPVVAFSFAIAAFALAGVPPLSGFMSKWLIYKAGIVAGGWGYLLSGAAIFNSVLSLGYYLPAVNAFYSPIESEKVKNAQQVPWIILVPVVLLSLSVIILGIYPDVGLAIVEPAVKNILDTLGVVR
jgi:formate hydrogenlyase subunit 3/multisubunit Na+/H+ antiporter MnhD subunit